MTVIACRDGIMAADSAVFQDGLCFGFSEKIKRLTDGSLIAAAGPRPAIQQFHAWMAKVVTGEYAPQPDALGESEFGGLWLKADGSVYRISYKFEIYSDPCPFAAEGIGVSFMMGALAHGASAEEAVRLAIAHCDGCGGDIQVERIDLLRPTPPHERYQTKAVRGHSWVGP